MKFILEEIYKDLEEKKVEEKDEELLKSLKENNENTNNIKDEIEKIYEEGKNQIVYNLLGESYIPKFDEEFSNSKKEEKSKEKIEEK